MISVLSHIRVTSSFKNCKPGYDATDQFESDLIDDLADKSVSCCASRALCIHLITYLSACRAMAIVEESEAGSKGLLNIG